MERWIPSGRKYKMHRREDTLILKGIPTDCGKKPWFEVFTDFCGVNITTAADFKSVPWYHWIQSWEDVPALVHHLWVTIWAGSIILRKWFLRDDHFSLKVLWDCYSFLQRSKLAILIYILIYRNIWLMVILTLKLFLVDLIFIF